MKLFALLTFVFCLGLVAAAPASTSTSKSLYSSTFSNSTQTSTAPSSTPTVSIGKPGQKARVKGRLFDINGKTQYFAGTNSWWLGHLPEDDDVQTALSEIAATGFLVTRVWGFGNINDPSASNGQVYYQVLNETLYQSGQKINYNATNGIPRLDSVISAAEKNDVKIVLTLLNNWNDLGGINTYTNAFGGNSTSFYTDSRSQDAYLAYISFIVHRYKSSPAIFAWELCNECRCRGCPSSTITNWASDTSAYIKALDSTHMVTLGDEGWFYPPEGDGSYAYSGYEGVDFIANLAIPTLDYGTFHLYPDQWGYDPSWGSTWIAQHNAAGKAAGKPVVLEEYASPSWEPNRTALMLPWQATVLNETSIAYDSFWQFATTLPTGMSDVDQYSIYYGTAEYGVLGTQHARDMLAKKAVATL